MKKITHQAILQGCRSAGMCISEYEARLLETAIDPFNIVSSVVVFLGKPFFYSIEEYNQIIKVHAQAFIHDAFMAGYQIFLINGIGGWEGNPDYEPSAPPHHFWMGIGSIRFTLELELAARNSRFSRQAEQNIKSDLRRCPLIPYFDKKYLHLFRERLEYILNLASDHRTKPAELVSIFCQVDNKHVHSLLAKNPNSSIELLIILAPEHVNDILLNPIMPLLVLENTIDSILLASRSNDVYFAISRVKKAPRWLEDWIQGSVTQNQKKLASLIPYSACSDSFNKWCSDKDYDIPF